MRQITIPYLVFFGLLSGCAQYHENYIVAPPQELPARQPQIDHHPIRKKKQKTAKVLNNNRCDAAYSQAVSIIAWDIHNGKNRAVHCVKTSSSSCWVHLSNALIRRHDSLEAMQSSLAKRQCESSPLIQLGISYFSESAEVARACGSVGVPYCLEGRLVAKMQRDHHILKVWTQRAN